MLAFAMGKKRLRLSTDKARQNEIEQKTVLLKKYFSLEKHTQFYF